MKSNTLISVRSNCNFALDYETGKLRPQTEIILITTSPKYVINKKKDGYTKESDIQEFRFLSSPDGVNILIGELQLLLRNMNIIEQNAAGFNVIIEASKNAQSSESKAE